MNKIKFLFGIMRVPFLILTPACVLLGVGAALWTNSQVNWFHFSLLLVAAICAHISVNAFNEYFDFKSGLDSMTQRTPFSGGSGTLQQRPQEARLALLVAWAAFLFTAFTGFYFGMVQGWSILLLGVTGLFLLIAYTPWLARNPWLCLVAPGLGFGPVMVISIAFALTGKYSGTAVAASLIPFFLVSDLLLLNQFPDVEADRRVGRRHIPILLGRRTASLVYNLFLLAAYLTIIFGVVFGLLPRISLLGLLSAILAIPAGIKAFRHANDMQGLAPALGMNVLVNLLTPVLVGIGLLIR